MGYLKIFGCVVTRFFLAVKVPEAHSSNEKPIDFENPCLCIKFSFLKITFGISYYQRQVYRVNVGEIKEILEK